MAPFHRPDPMHAQTYFQEVVKVAQQIDLPGIEKLATELAALRERHGRLFFIGVGGSAGNCGHAVNDFRKLCGIESYAPTDNVSELTARTNDEGWETVFAAWLRTSRGNKNDAVFVFSVGGGNLEKNVSPNIVAALKEAKERGMKIFGVVGRDGGYTKKVGDNVILIPTVDAARVTPHTEAFHAVVWHCLVSHPALQQIATKW
jgi:D-sedoheptulose 7-phosphate isomerase